MTPDTAAADPDDDELADARERAREAVAVDTALTPRERETIFRTAEDRDTLDMFTQERGLMRRLLAHPEASVAFVTVASGDVGGEAVPLAEYDGRQVIGVKAELPVGCLSVAQEPRQTGTHADMITDRVIRADGGRVLADEPAPDDVPDTRAIAERLNVDPGQLRSFVGHHPNPEPAYVLGWAGADPEHREAVAAWLRERERERARRRDRRELGGEER